MSPGIYGLVIVTRYRFVVLGYILSFPYYISILYGFISLGQEGIRYRFPKKQKCMFRACRPCTPGGDRDQKG